MLPFTFSMLALNAVTATDTDTCQYYGGFGGFKGMRTVSNDTSCPSSLFDNSVTHSGVTWAFQDKVKNSASNNSLFAVNYPGQLCQYSQGKGHGKGQCIDFNNGATDVQSLSRDLVSNQDLHPEDYVIATVFGWSQDGGGVTLINKNLTKNETKNFWSKKSMVHYTHKVKPFAAFSQGPSGICNGQEDAVDGEAFLLSTLWSYADEDGDTTSKIVKLNITGMLSAECGDNKICDFHLEKYTTDVYNGKSDKVFFIKDVALLTPGSKTKKAKLHFTTENNGFGTTKCNGGGPKGHSGPLSNYNNFTSVFQIEWDGENEASGATGLTFDPSIRNLTKWNSTRFLQGAMIEGICGTTYATMLFQTVDDPTKDCDGDSTQGQGFLAKCSDGKCTKMDDTDSYPKTLFVQKNAQNDAIPGEAYAVNRLSKSVTVFHLDGDSSKSTKVDPAISLQSLDQPEAFFSVPKSYFTGKTPSPSPTNPSKDTKANPSKDTKAYRSKDSKAAHEANLCTREEQM
eukprot:g3191.t1